MILLAKMGVGVLGVALVGGAAVSSEGFIHVKVREKQADGTNLNLVVPAALVPGTLRFIPPHHLAQAADNLRPFLPVIDAAIPALEQCPNGVLVEVFDGKEHVLIAKRDGSLVVEVKDAEETVHVSVPLRTAQSSIHQIAKQD